MTPVVGATIAASIQAIMNGLCLQAMTMPKPPDRHQIRTILAHVIGAKPG